MQRRPTATVAAPANNDLAAMPSHLRSQAGSSDLILIEMTFYFVFDGHGTALNSAAPILAGLELAARLLRAASHCSCVGWCDGFGSRADRRCAGTSEP